MGTPRGEMRAGIAIGIFDGVQNVLAGDSKVIQTEVFELEEACERDSLCARFAAFFKPSRKTRHEDLGYGGRGRPLA